MFAEIIIPLALPKNYTWSVPENFQDAMQPGIRVEVMLKKKKYSGIVKKISTDKPGDFAVKPILNVLDDTPLIYTNQLHLWEWIGDYYMCSEGEVMNAGIPSNLKLSSETVILWNEEHDEDFTDLDDKEYVVAEALNLKKQLKLNEVQQILDASYVYPVIKRLIDKQVCYVWEELREKYKEKKETWILLHPKYAQEDQLSELLNKGSKAPKQTELLLSYLHLIKTAGEVTQSELLKKSNASAAQLKGLLDKKILVADKRSVNRIPSLPKNIQLNFELSDSQQQALSQIQHSFKSKAVCLLHGITGSGKTLIYIKLIEAYMKQGKQVLYMLPEIALTAQIIRRLQIHFGGHIAIYHSKFNANERVEIWNRVKTGDIKIVLGARSSLFLPFKELGLIIADEEHETSYKQQEPAPYYHARDAAIYYASLFGARVLLGSGTPSVESYYNCTTGKYALVNLNERYGLGVLPQIEIVDLKKLSSKEKIILSPQLNEAISNSLAEKKQVILFQNRRGYAPYLSCNTCGWIPQCRNCDVTLTFHKAKNKMICHYCGTDYPVLHTCMACGSSDFRQRNFGTEKIEEVIAEAFPQAHIARMDYDSVKGKNDHDTLIKLFEQQRIDILVGTQMVVKGLDFEQVNLVGILDADSILNFADFRVNERAFQLMEQVSGRAGRKDDLGKVIIQVSNTMHPVLQLVQNHNYTQFFNFEIASRKEFFYPPFSRIIQITFKHRENHIAEEAANLMAQGLKSNFQSSITGPAQPLVPRIRNKYLWEILIKLPKDALMIAQCKKAIQQQMAMLLFNKRYRATSIIPFVDPV